MRTSVNGSSSLNLNTFEVKFKCISITHEKEFLVYFSV